MKPLDVLELELRRLSSVSFVAFDDSVEPVIVQVIAPTAADPALLRSQAERTCRAHLDRTFVVEIVAGTRPSRIRLLEVHVRPRDTDGADEVEVHLALEGLRTVGRAPGSDPTAAASATFDALQGLGARVPFHVEAAALFEHVLGEGVMLVLASEQSGHRYGVAAGANVEQAAVRATLHALNRYLATQALPALTV